MNVESTVSLAHPETGEALPPYVAVPVNGNDAQIRAYIRAGYLRPADEAAVAEWESTGDAPQAASVEQPATGDLPASATRTQPVKREKS